MLYELIYGVLPFWPTGKLSTYRDPRDRMLAFTEAIFQDIKTENYAFHEKPYASAECKDLIDKLLVVDINQRLGGGEIKNHPWFANKMDWTKLNNKELDPPGSFLSHARNLWMNHNIRKKHRKYHHQAPRMIFLKSHQIIPPTGQRNVIVTFP